MKKKKEEYIIAKELLEQKYFVENRNIKEIAEELGLPEHVFFKWIDVIYNAKTKGIKHKQFNLTDYYINYTFNTNRKKIPIFNS